LNINDYLTVQLQHSDTTMDEFQNLLHRLLERQVITRHNNARESEFYDLYVRNEHLVQEYLSILGFSLVRNEVHDYIIIFPPGARIPGVREDELNHTAFIKRLKSNEKILLLTLRSIYEEKLREGNADEKGFVHSSMEIIQTRFFDISEKHIPASSTEKKEMFLTLKKLRLIQYESLEHENDYVAINHSICHFVLDDYFRVVGELQNDEESS